MENLLYVVLALLGLIILRSLFFWVVGSDLRRKMLRHLREQSSCEGMTLHQLAAALELESETEPLKNVLHDCLQKKLCYVKRADGVLIESAESMSGQIWDTCKIFPRGK